MDGNRRYAAKKNLHKLIGHQHGVNSIKFCLECCHVLGVKEVSIYAFSLENFKREKEEVDYLMELTKTNLL